MKMGTYSDRNAMLPEENKGMSIPHFAWFYPGNIYSASKNSFSSSQANSEHCIDVAPIRCVGPITEPIKNINTGSKQAKGKKQKASAKDLNQVELKISKPKKPKKSPSVSKKTNGQSTPAVKREKNNSDIMMDTSTLDFSSIPSPVCSCTGVARVCYKWGVGGWQSSCCTISVSEYPLPMSPSRPGARMAGRKMSNGAYGKLLLRLTAEGYDLNQPIDLKDHWARHGTNKFVTIK